MAGFDSLAGAGAGTALATRPAGAAIRARGPADRCLAHVALVRMEDVVLVGGFGTGGGSASATADFLKQRGATSIVFVGLMVLTYLLMMVLWWLK